MQWFSLGKYESLRKNEDVIEIIVNNLIYSSISNNWSEKFLKATCNIFMYLINNWYLWYVKLVNVYKRLPIQKWSKDVPYRNSLKETKKSNYLNLFSKYVRYSYFLIRFLLKYQHNKWIKNIFLKSWYHRYQNHGRYKIVIKKEKQDHVAVKS